MPGNQTRCFAIRRLSPFQGCLQVIEACDAQTSSSNGIDWRVQIRIQTPLSQSGSMDGSEANHQFILFGFWSSEGGFHRVPLPPQINSRQIEIAAQPIMDVLLEQTHNVPFTQQDECELWLLDENEYQPLVLIAATGDPQHLPSIRNPGWQATLHTDHSFIRNGDTAGNDNARQALDELIKHSTGQNPPAQWFQRQADGSGKAIASICIDKKLTDRTLPKEAFPELLIRESWSDDDAQNLVQDYIKWQAPFLLTLPTLSTLTRKRIEQLAFKQIFKVEGQYKLYPKIIDKDRLKTVLIEAQIRRNNPHAGEKN